MGLDRSRRLHRSFNSIVSEIVILAALAAPIILGLIGGTAFSVIDSYMLSPIGELALACASLTNSVLIIFFSALFGLASPVSILAGKAFGARADELIAIACSDGLRVALIGGILGAVIMLALLPAMALAGQPPEVIAALPTYWILMALSLIPFSLSMVIKLLLDAIGRPWIAALLSFVPVAVVIPLNWLLIYGHWGFPALGLAGAGAATLVAQSVGFLAMRLYIIWRQRLDIRILDLGNRAGVVEFARHGLPMSLQYLAESSAVGVIGILVGLFGSAALAANQVALSLGELIYMVPLGLAGAVGIVIAQALGEKADARVRAIGIASFVLVLLVTVPLSAMMIFGGAAIAEFFVHEMAVKTLLVGLLATIGAVQIFDGLQSVALGALRGLLDNRWPTTIALTAHWIIAIPMSVLLGFAFNMGPIGAWSGFGAGVLFAAVLLIGRFLRQSRRMTDFA
ncbi:MAG: MATE family efflux transporter [Hyphomicrobium sp.]|uniref:MATE family efflux transporter n=1 Tax=Hyphomicrobium sp. TaxID=82 RepID=UPI0039E6D398